MRILRFWSTTANLDHVVKIEVLQAERDFFKLCISFSDGTVAEFFFDNRAQSDEVTNKLAEMFKNPRITEICLDEIIAQAKEE